MIFNPKTLALFITLLFILGSCKNNGKSQLYNQIHLDSIKINEIKSLISEFIKSNIASEYFSLQRSPLSYDWGDINDSIRLANPTFHKLILKKMENDELNKDQIPWSETIVPRAVIIGELKLDDQTNIFLDKKIAAYTE